MNLIEHEKTIINRLNRRSFINSTYKTIYFAKLDQKIKTGEKGKCRYCGQKEGSVQFQKIAHSFPELIGNKFLFSLDECDECNEFFDKNLENHLANYLGIFRTTHKVNGKNGVPKFKGSNGERIENIDNNIVIIEPEDSNALESLTEENILSISVEKSTYIPIQVYKCFVKMALSILPETELSKFKDTIDWVRFDIRPKQYDTSFLKIYRTFITGIPPLDNIRCMLFKRKSPSESLPYIFCIIQFKFYTYQFILPFSKKDRLLSPSKLNFVPYPPIHFSPNQIEPDEIIEIDLTSEDKVFFEKDISTFKTSGGFSEIDVSEIPDKIKERVLKMGLKFK
ncbi:HNH endonuclease [Aeromonas salmonicida]|uniref:HNH endonuclease n=1 Tax=Aeromonas salmonicida TaxID=645 RepID=UPI0012D8C079|nr:HNH endonuclease [Aeromonas salmonicida]MUG28057.1 HNH endonuclease [Aeromonas salmonicida]